MFARVTQFEIDTLRLSMEAGLERFLAVVLPRLKQQPGFEGVYVMHTPDGKGELLTLWSSEEAAQSTLASGFWGEQVSEFVTFMRQAPGREHYEVVYAEAPREVAA
jgi:hypothetical protein